MERTPPDGTDHERSDGSGRTRRAVLGALTAGAVTVLTGCLAGGDVDRETSSEQFTMSEGELDIVRLDWGAEIHFVPATPEREVF